jgi:hypothetical protein
MSRGNEYFFPKPVNLDELLAKLRPYGIKAALWEHGDTHVLIHVALYIGSLGTTSEKFLLILDDDPDRIFGLDDCMKDQETPSTTIMNAIRDAVGCEFFPDGDLPERLEQAPRPTTGRPSPGCGTSTSGSRPARTGPPPSR